MRSPTVRTSTESLSHAGAHKCSHGKDKSCRAGRRRTRSRMFATYGPLRFVMQMWASLTFPPADPAHIRTQIELALYFAN